MVLSCKVLLVCSTIRTYYQCLRKMQYWQIIDILRPIGSYCFYKDICPSPNQSLTYCNCQHCTYMLYDHSKIAASGPRGGSRRVRWVRTNPPFCWFIQLTGSLLLPAVFDTERWRASASPVWLLYNLLCAIQRACSEVICSIFLTVELASA